MNTYLYLSFLLFIAVVSSNKCPLDITLTQKVDVGGFHGRILWLLERSEKTIELNCQLAIFLNVSPEMFVNPDQIADLNRSGELKAFINGKVDVEEVAHLAAPHSVTIFTKNQQNSSINLPIHLRYQRPLIGEVFSKIIVPKPSVLALCPQNIACKGNLVEAPCRFNEEQTCQWRNVTYEALFDEVVLMLPIGDLDDYSIVSVFSLLLGCAGCIYALSMLAGRPL